MSEGKHNEMATTDEGSILHELFECRRCSIEAEPHSQQGDTLPAAKQDDTLPAASISDPLPPAPSIAIEAPAADETDDSTPEPCQEEAANGCFEDPVNRCWAKFRYSICHLNFLTARLPPMTCRDFNGYVGVCADDETEELRTRLACGDAEVERKLCVHSYQVTFVGGLLSVIVGMVLTAVFLLETKNMVNEATTLSSDTEAWSEPVYLPEIAIVVPHPSGVAAGAETSHIMSLRQCTIPDGDVSRSNCTEYNTSTLENIVVPKFEVITNNSFSYELPGSPRVQGTFGDPIYTYCEVAFLPNEDYLDGSVLGGDVTVLFNDASLNPTSKQWSSLLLSFSSIQRVVKEIALGPKESIQYGIDSMSPEFSLDPRAKRTTTVSYVGQYDRFQDLPTADKTYSTWHYKVIFRSALRKSTYAIRYDTTVASLVVSMGGAFTALTLIMMFPIVIYCFFQESVTKQVYAESPPHESRIDRYKHRGEIADLGVASEGRARLARSREESNLTRKLTSQEREEAVAPQDYRHTRLAPL